MTRKKKLFLILVIGWLCFIFAHSLMDHTTTYTESSIILQPVQEISPGISHDTLRKIAHFAIFAIWGGLLYGLFRQYDNFNLLRPIGIALCGAFADETIQLFVPGRYGAVVDMWIDLAGAVSVIAAIHTVSVLIARKRQRSRTSSEDHHET